MIAEPSLAKNQMLQKESARFPVKILLVDDRSENLTSLESLLKTDGENVQYLLANSGEEALKIALREELALILLDVQMPVMNGYEVARFLRNNKRTGNIPVIFVTAIDQDASHMMEGFEAGAVDFLFKPLNPFITKAKVAAFIRFYIQKKELECANDSIKKLNNELEARVEERTKELVRINNDLDNFIYTASHDLKAPISNIEGLMHNFYDVLNEQQKMSPDLLNIKDMIDFSIERFKNTLLDLTEVAKAQSEEVLDNSRIDLHDLVEEVKLSINNLIVESEAEIEEDFTSVSELCFSKKNLRSIIYNLLSNAIKYRSPDRIPKILIHTSVSGCYLLLKVKDNGLGIRQEDLEKVFGMFKRLHTHVEGTGIGMSIVKKIVENVGGKIELESQVGVGTEFTIYLRDEVICS